MIKKKKKSEQKNSSKIITLCKTHKKYKPDHPPKIDCLTCWKIYATHKQIVAAILKLRLKEKGVGKRGKR